MMVTVLTAANAILGWWSRSRFPSHSYFSGPGTSERNCSLVIIDSSMIDSAKESIPPNENDKT
jgi:hypothetical protein